MVVVEYSANHGFSQDWKNSSPTTSGWCWPNLAWANEKKQSIRPQLSKNFKQFVSEAIEHVFSFYSCSCRGTEKAQVRHAGKAELSARENVWENKATSIKGKTLLHNSVASEQMPMLRRSETQFREEKGSCLAGEGNSTGPFPRETPEGFPSSTTWHMEGDGNSWVQSVHTDPPCLSGSSSPSNSKSSSCPIFQNLRAQLLHYTHSPPPSKFWWLSCIRCPLELMTLAQHPMLWAGNQDPPKSKYDRRL